MYRSLTITSFLAVLVLGQCCFADFVVTSTFVMDANPMFSPPAGLLATNANNELGGATLTYTATYDDSVGAMYQSFSGTGYGPFAGIAPISASLSVVGTTSFDGTYAPVGTPAHLLAASAGSQLDCAVCSAGPVNISDLGFSLPMSVTLGLTGATTKLATVPPAIGSQVDIAHIGQTPMASPASFNRVSVTAMGSTVTSTNFTYTQIATVVPEPSSFLMLALVCGVVVAAGNGAKSTWFRG